MVSKSEMFEKIMITIICICLIVIGWAGNEVYKDFSSKNVLDGLYLKNWNNNETDKYTEERDSKGDWVCVNVRGMDFSRGIEVCQHECGHAVFDEIYAEMCEDDPNKCIKEMK